MRMRMAGVGRGEGRWSHSELCEEQRRTREGICRWRRRLLAPQ